MEFVADDVETAFKRHATSKIKDENDLFRITDAWFPWRSHTEYRFCFSFRTEKHAPVNGEEHELS